ncbi:YvcK family protein [Candidatus Pacebacteria bacterium]|nr:YvcK family protein [Candidatus Paceibacterota bacterium]
MYTKAQRKKVVVIGGGTGTYNLLRGLKEHHESLDITKIVPMADSGGSNARIRDEFGLLPLSDVNRGLAALSSDVEETGQLLRQLFLYRFNKGNGIEGHNFGNLLLVALTDMLGNEEAAIKAASRILRIRGTVLPVTADDIHLVATYDDGEVVTGEHDIDEPTPERENKRITNLRIEPEGTVNAETATALAEADLIIMGPGDLYTSILASCIITGVPELLRDSPAKLVYVSNLMSRPGQTRTMQVSDYVSEVEKYVHRKPDTVLINTTPLPEDVLHTYESEGDYPVVDDLGDDTAVVRDDFLATTLVKKKSGDVLARSLIRHDGRKLTNAILKLL